LRFHRDGQSEIDPGNLRQGDVVGQEHTGFLHLHDTEGKALANTLAALQVGIRHFDKKRKKGVKSALDSCEKGNKSQEQT